jgi:hypothetical protein
VYLQRANGARYPLLGETRERHFAGINLTPRKRPENAVTRRSCLRSPEDVPLDLVETRTFGSRVIYERYGRIRDVSD